MIWTLASACERNGGRGGLYDDNLIMLPMALDWIDASKISILIVAGIVASSLSSALAALVGAPRVFQAVAKDPLFPPIKKFANGIGPNDEPIRAYCLTFVIAVGFMMLGDLNTIAPFITNFFMVSYALINWACFQADMSGSPGWRPTWKFYNPWFALVGAVLCIACMFMISYIVALVTLLVCLALYKYVESLKVEVNWGSVGHALTWSDTVTSLSRLEKSKQEHVKNYRMSPLVMAGCPGERIDLVFFFHQLRKGGGFMVAGNVIAGSIVHQDEIEKDGDFARLTPLVRAHIRNNWYSENAFSVVQEVTVANSLLEGIRSMLLTCGVGKLRPNMLALGYRKAWDDANQSKETEGYVESIRDAIRLDFSVAIMRNYSHQRFGKENTVDEVGALKKMANAGADVAVPSDDAVGEAGESSTSRKTLRAVVTNRVMGPESRTGIIDIWWLDDSGGVELLLPHLLIRHENWRKCKLRLFVPKDKRAGSKNAQVANIKDLLHRVRIKIDDVVVIDLKKTANLGVGSTTKKELNVLRAKIAELKTVESAGADSGKKEAEKDDVVTKGRLAESAILGEAIASASGEAELVVVSLPFPKNSIDHFSYMAMLDLTSRSIDRPVLFLRGTQKRVLTMDS